MTNTTEREQIVAWLRQEHDEEIARSKELALSSPHYWEALRQAAHCGATADAIERGDHLKESN